MANLQTPGLLRHLRNLVAAHCPSEKSDVHLLQQFIVGSDESAFATLIQRHGNMVLRICRNVLRDLHEAEDVFQATFLVLARRAATIRNRQALSSWLHGVAYRLALKVKARSHRLQDRRPSLHVPVVSNALDDLTLRESHVILHEELHELPEKYRSALLLCYWEGKTRDEAAELLGMTAGRFKKCLERARALLGSRLTQRGLLPTAGFFTALLTADGVRAAVPTALTSNTAQAAVAYATGKGACEGVPAAAAVALANGAIQTMILSKWATTFVVVLLLIGVGTGLGLTALYAPGAGSSQGPAKTGEPKGKAAADSSEPTGNAEGSLKDLPGFNDYKVDPYLRAAAILQAMGKDKACASLAELARDEEHGAKAIFLCRMLFARKPDGEFRRAMLGQAVFLGGTNYTGWPLEPIELVDGVPFLITRGYQLDGKAERADNYLAYCLENCRWNDFAFKALDQQAKEKALAKLLASPKWNTPLAKEDVGFLKSQIVATAGAGKVDAARPSVSLSLSKVSAERGEIDVFFRCDLVLDNATGKDLIVRSSYFSACDGLSLLVTTKDGKELADQPYTFHQSPFTPDPRDHRLEKGKTGHAIVFPIRMFPADVKVVKVKLHGTLPGSEYRGLLSSETIEVNVKDAAADKKPPKVGTKEIPNDWNRADIADAAPPRSDAGPVHVLAWKVLEDDRPLRVEYCLVLKQLQKPTEKQERWVLASLVRNPKKGKQWDFVTIWLSPDPAGKAPPLIMHVEHYKDRPTNADVYKFMDKYDWKLGADRDWKLIDGGVCEAWERVIGEKPVRSFTHLTDRPS